MTKNIWVGRAGALIGALGMSLFTSGCIGQTGSGNPASTLEQSKVLHVVPEGKDVNAFDGTYGQLYNQASSDIFKNFSYVQCGTTGTSRTLTLVNTGVVGERYLHTNEDGSVETLTGANDIDAVTVLVQVNDPSKLTRITINGTVFTAADLMEGTYEIPNAGEYDAAARLPGHYLTYNVGALPAGETLNIEVSAEGRSGLAVHFDAWGLAPCNKVLVSAAWNGTTVCVKEEALTGRESCPDTETSDRQWTIENPNATEVEATWSVDGSAPEAITFAPGSNGLVTPFSAGANRLTITYGDGETLVLTSDIRACDFRPSVIVASRCSDTPAVSQNWTLTMTSPVAREVTWSLGDDSASGSIILNPGESTNLTTPAQASGTTQLVVRYAGEVVAMAAGSTERCGPICVRRPYKAVANPALTSVRSAHAIYLPGVATDFVFDSEARFEEYGDDTAHLTGRIYSLSNGGRRMDVDVWFRGRTADAPAGSPKRELNASAYGPAPLIDVAGWNYFPTVEGSMLGRGDLSGTGLAIRRSGAAAQIGFGANGKNANYGLSVWFEASRTWGACRLDGHGDINIDLDAECL